MLAILIVTAVVISGVLIIRDMRNSYHTATVSHQETVFRATEKFKGIINGKTIVFEHENYAHYRLTVNGFVTTGDLNTERGFGSDINATVFILDWEKPVDDQKIFVRFTGDTTHISMFDTKRANVIGILVK